MTMLLEVENLLNDKKEYNKMAKAVNPYGNGNASTIIYDFISDHI